MSRLCRHTPSMALHLDVNPDRPWRAHVPVDTAFYESIYDTFGKESSIGHAVTSLIFFFAKTCIHVGRVELARQHCSLVIYL